VHTSEELPVEGSKVVGNVLGLHSVDLCVSRGDLDLLREGHQGLKAVPRAGKQVAVDAQCGEDTVFSGLEKDLLCRRTSCSASAPATCTLTTPSHCRHPVWKLLTLHRHVLD